MRQPLLLGHRGARASRQIPENTLASFELCLRHGCDGFEFDVRCSADGHAVVCHDPLVRGMKIAETPASVLGLPTLEEVLQKFGGRAFLDIELKVAGLEDSTICAMRDHPAQKGCVVSSFLPEVLTTIYKKDATVALGFLCDNRKRLRRWQDLPVKWVAPQFELADLLLIDQVRASGKKTMVWTVNREDEVRRLTSLGVDAIISDETEMLVRCVGP